MLRRWSRVLAGQIGCIQPFERHPQRDVLDEAWVRQAEMNAGDREALWAWVQCSSGRDDLPAWKRLKRAFLS